MGRHVENVTGRTPRKAPLEEQRVPERWELDSKRSRLTFAIRHLILHQIGGSFERCGGTLFLDRDHPSFSTLEVWVDLSSLKSDSPERDAHVLTSELLDVAEFPRATFSSTTVEVGGSDIVVNGRLELHGVVRDVELKIRPAKVPRPSKRGQRETFFARAKIDRQAFGLHWNQDVQGGGGVVGDEVEIEAQVEVVHAPDDP